MPDKLSSADVIAINSAEEIVGVINELSSQIPELAFFAASPVAKTSYKTLVRTALPTAGFRAINAGRTRDVGTLEARTVECKFLDASWDADLAALTGVDWGDPVAEQQSAHLLAALKALQLQIWNGTGADANGFPGANSLFPYSDSAGVIDAGGTTAATGSSIYLVKTSEQDACLAWGNGGEIAVGDVVEQQLYDGTGKPYMGRAQSISGWAGLQITNSKSIVRIANVTADSGKGATDDLIYQGIELFAQQYGVDPDGIFMSHRSRRQLRESRTATNATGAAAPIPTDVGGIPVFATNGILNTEALLAATP